MSKAQKPSQRTHPYKLLLLESSFVLHHCFVILGVLLLDRFQQCLSVRMVSMNTYQEVLKLVIMVKLAISFCSYLVFGLIYFIHMQLIMRFC
jgi:hypothetical protein